MSLASQAMSWRRLMSGGEETSWFSHSHGLNSFHRCVDGSEEEEGLLHLGGGWEEGEEGEEGRSLSATGGFCESFMI